mmetsp:Transcript_73860/g.196616  ORF Transcript_73860/g.196616 Transcript_73860/m.196616 type:complete len:137 (-) Transcript_73860:278-688(-)
MARSSTLGHPLQGCRVLLFVRFGCSGPPCPLCEALLLQWDVDIAADTLIWRADKFCIPHLERLCGPVGPPPAAALERGRRGHGGMATSGTRLPPPLTARTPVEAPPPPPPLVAFEFIGLTVASALSASPCCLAGNS